MAEVKKRTLRTKLETNLALPSTVTLETWRANATDIQVAIYDADGVAAITDIQSVNCKVQPSQLDDTTLMDSTVAAASMDADLTAAEWVAGTDQHATFSFTNSETNLTLTLPSLNCWIVFTATLTGGEEVTLAAGALTIHEDNNAAGDPPATNPGTAITIEEADARYLQSMDWKIKTDDFTAVNGGRYVLNNAAKAFMITLPDDVPAHTFEIVVAQWSSGSLIGGTTSGTLTSSTSNVITYNAAGAWVIRSVHIPDVYSRSNHTGTQPLSTISDAGTAAAVDVEDLPVSTTQETALNAKAHVSAFGRVTPITENSFSSFDPSDVSGFTLSNATFSSDASGDFATLSATNGPTNSGSATKSITSPASGDYIFYAKIQSDSIGGSGLNIQLGSSTAKLICSLGYNYATSSYEADRVSFVARNSGGYSGGVAGPSIEFDKTVVEVAMQYDSRFGIFNYFVRGGGVWVYYGSGDCDDPYDSSIKLYTGGGDAADSKIYDVRVIRPSVVSIGDSICAGHNFYDPDPDFYGGTDPYTNSWQSYAGFSSTVDGIIVNAGVGSESSSDILARVPALLTACEPDVVFLQASSNDYAAGFTTTQRTAYMQSSIDLITATGAKVIVLNGNYANSAHGDYAKSWWTNNRYDLTGVTEYIDTMEGLTGGDGYNESTLFEADGVHPNSAGYAVMGGKVQARIDWLESGDASVKENSHANFKSIKTDVDYANDAAAAVGGVPINAIYRVTGGTTAWRQT